MPKTYFIFVHVHLSAILLCLLSLDRKANLLLSIVGLDLLFDATVTDVLFVRVCAIILVHGLEEVVILAFAFNKGGLTV